MRQDRDDRSAGYTSIAELRRWITLARGFSVFEKDAPTQTRRLISDVAGSGVAERPSGMVSRISRESKVKSQSPLFKFKALAGGNYDQMFQNLIPRGS